ncbi:protein kinase domain-containing protein [Rhodocaloribacter sp.]
MDSTRWQRVKTLFERTLDRPPPERAAFLDEACASDPLLRHEIDSLLRAADDEADFLEVPATQAALDVIARTPDPVRPGRRLGSYRIVAELGRGGMGAVYLAERDDGLFEQQVAVKVVRSDLDRDNTERRFARERSILAALKHPHIARLYDGGMTDDGRPYLVMEYIDGRSLTVYCDAHRLSIRQRLELFRDVCAAVQYAHQNLVVHRDLKPSNILVTEGSDGVPTVKLLDFGIAKLLDAGKEDVPGRPAPRTAHTVMTPEYAAPEQVRRQPVTTATDVYSLGVILYELLSGRRPYRLRGLRPSEVERLICEGAPAAPSTAVLRTARASDETGEDDAAARERPETISRARSTQPEKLHRRLRGDLDKIVLKAMRKEPERRYTSAAELAEDLRRHLAGLPVRAHTDTLSYRTTKFIRRHRFGAAAAVLLFLLLVGGIAATRRQARIAEAERRRAEQRFADVRALANTLIFDVHDTIADLPGATAARELLVRRALTYLDKLAREAENDASLQLELAEAYRRIGDVLGNPNNANLGRPQEALLHYRKALALARAAPETVTPEQARLTRALIFEKMADVLAVTGDLVAADSGMQAAVALYAAQARQPSATPDQRFRHAVSLIKLGDLTGNPNFPNRDKPEQALALYDPARPILERLYAADTTYLPALRMLGVLDERVGAVYELLNDTMGARAAYRASLARRKTVAARNPDNMDAVRDLAIAYEKMGNVALRAGDLEEAHRQYIRSKDIFDDLLRADSLNVQARQSLAISLLHLGDLQGHPDRRNLGDPLGARRNYRAALALLEPAFAADTSNTQLRFLTTLLRERLRMLAR